MGFFAPSLHANALPLGVHDIAELLARIFDQSYFTLSL